MDLGLTIDAVAQEADSAPQQPEGRTCGCGEVYPWTWHVPRTASGRVYRGRWASPKVDPCPRCQPVGGLDVEMASRQRCRDASIPEPLLGYRLDARQGYLVMQDDDEEEATFRDRIQRMNADGVKRIGVTLANAHAMRVLYRWKPPAWLVLHGPVGTGKTTLIAALVRRLLEQPPDVVEDLPPDRFVRMTDEQRAFTEARGLMRTTRRKAVPIVEYHRVDDLLRREQIKVRGLDPNPTADAAKRPNVLVLDELGLTERPSEAEARMIERILCYRADHGICTALATNRTWDELTAGKRPLYGRRVADRLRRATEVALVGASWR